MADTTHKLPGDYVLPIPDVPSAAGLSEGPRLRIPGHELRRELARGGMGVVLEAWSQRLSRLVAVKLLLTLPDPELAARIRREAEAATRLDHPNLVPVLEHGDAAGFPYLVMELVEGESLEARVRRAGPLPEREAARIVRALADALAHVHAHGVLHRDLKPANVVLQPDGTPRLIDFGLARLEDQEQRLTVTGALLGTPAYMAPEQALGRTEEVDPRTDVYGLGTVLYELLTGSPPFVAQSAMATIEAVVARQAVPPGQLRAGLDPDLTAICMRCLEKAPDRRFPGAAELRDALAAWERRRPARRDPLLLAGAAALLGGVGLALVVALVLAGPAPGPAPGPAATAAVPSRSPDPPPAPRSLTDASDAELIALADELARRDPASLDPTARAILELGRHLALQEEHPDPLLSGAPLRALEDAPPPWGDLGRAHRHIQERRGEPALQLLRELARRLPRLCHVRLLLAGTLRGLGRGEEALEELGRAVEELPHDAQLRSQRGLLRGALGDLAGAGEDLQAALRLAPPGARALRIRLHLRLGEVHYRCVRGPEAERELDRALELDPGSALALALRGQVRLMSKDLTGAEADLQRALELGPPGPDTLALRAVLALQRGRPLEALQAADQALAQEPDRGEAHAHRAEALMALGDLVQARHAAEEAIRLSPDLTASCVALARVAARGGDVEQARAAAAHAARVDPAAVRLQEEVERLAARFALRLPPAQRDRLVRELAGAQDRAAWLRLMDQAIAAAPRDPGLRLVRGYGLRASGDATGAAADLAAASGQEVLEGELHEVVQLMVGLGLESEAQELLASQLHASGQAPPPGVMPSDVEARLLLLQLRLKAAPETAALDQDTDAMVAALPEGCFHAATALWLRSRARATRGDLAGALADLRRLLELDARGAPVPVSRQELERAEATLRGR